MTTANVRSIEGLREFRAAVLIFQTRVNDAIQSMKEEVFSALDWIENDRPRHWHAAELKAFDRISEARVQLEIAKMRKETADFRPSLIEEKQAVRDAKDWLAHCQEKVRLVKAAIVRVRHEADEFQGRLSQIERLVETDLPRLLGLLEAMLRALEAYAEVTTRPAEDAEGSDS